MSSKAGEVQALFNFGIAVYHVVVPQNSDIKTPLDFKGKKYGFNPIGNATNFGTEAIFEAYGLKEGDLKEFRGSEADLLDAVKDKLVDVTLFLMLLGVADMLDLVTANHVGFIPVTGTYRDAIIAKYPYYSACVIPKEIYGTSEDCDAFGLASFLAVDASMDEDLAYTLTKTFYENLDELKVMIPGAKALSVQGGVCSVVPLHPGAEK